MTVTIREGVYYKNRRGDKIGPMEIDDYGDGQPFTFEGAWYSPNGRWHPREETHHDLIAEWTEGPVRTVTRTVTEIVPGNYGVVSVRSVHPGKDGNANVYIPAQHLTSAELKAAAAVLLELAGALE